MESDSFTCILLTSDHDHLAASAESYARTFFDVRLASRQARSQTLLPPELHDLIRNTRIDFLFNFLSPTFVPSDVLRAVKRASINFHPAPPEWPGVGSASYALYENDVTFGATAHLMTEEFDAGQIIRTVRFPIAPDDTCDRLFDRALNFSLILFYEVLFEIAQGGQVSLAKETWKRKAISRAEFERWMTLSPLDPPGEIQRKVRALRHSSYAGPFIEVAGFRFELPPRKAPEAESR